jgi:hypothetical protein
MWGYASTTKRDRLAIRARLSQFTHWKPLMIRQFCASSLQSRGPKHSPEIPDAWQLSASCHGRVWYSQNNSSCSSSAECQAFAWSLGVWDFHDVQDANKDLVWHPGLREGYTRGRTVLVQCKPSCLLCVISVLSVVSKLCKAHLEPRMHGRTVRVAMI